MLRDNQKDGAAMFKKNTTGLFVASAAFIIACIFYVYVFLISTRDEVRNLNSWVDHSKTIISQVYVTMTLQEAMLAEQRAYLLTGDPKFLSHFEGKQGDLLSSAKNLVDLTNDNPPQNRRADEIFDFANQYIAYLNKRKDSFQDMYKGYNREQIDKFMGGLGTVDLLHDRLAAMVEEFLNEENILLKNRIHAADEKRRDYSRNLVLSLFGACAFIMLMNWVLFQTQKRFYLDSERLRNIDDRHKIAIRAANDGVFDWDIKNKAIFLSAQIFKMCGYDKEDYEGSLLGLTPYMAGVNLLDLIHPDDISGVRQNLQHFVEGLTSEYNNTFRVRHANGYWIWIHARGGGIFDQTGKPIKLIGSHSDITTQRQMEERLKKEMEDAEKSSKSKMEFLAHMSHEIRTPLTTVTGISEILGRQSHMFNEKQQNLIKTLISSSTTLKDLINDVLDFSKIDSGEVQLEKSAVHLDTLVSEVVSIMSVQALERGIDFSADHAGIADIVFEGDHSRIRQIIINLVGNAIKFTERGSVRIVSSLQSFIPEDSTGILSISVIDTGIGISPLYHEIIFDKFRQVDDTISKGFGGTGLGLPISKSLAEMMNGTLAVDSAADKGSTFILQIPIKILNCEEFVGNKKSERLLASIKDHQNSNVDNAEQKVLMVEDYQGNIVVIGYILDELGVSYDVARNGLEAVEKSGQYKYNAILMDLQMPHMDGLTATLRIREKEKQSGIDETPIIGMTAHATYKDKNSCMEAGMNAFISKPIDHSKLVEVLRQYLKRN